jgi:hypothetical protein
MSGRSQVNGFIEIEIEIEIENRDRNRIHKGAATDQDLV